MKKRQMQFFCRNSSVMDQKLNLKGIVAANESYGVVLLNTEILRVNQAYGENIILRQGCTRGSSGIDATNVKT